MTDCKNVSIWLIQYLMVRLVTFSKRSIFVAVQPFRAVTFSLFILPLDRPLDDLMAAMSIKNTILRLSYIVL